MGWFEFLLFLAAVLIVIMWLIRVFRDIAARTKFGDDVAWIQRMPPFQPEPICKKCGNAGWQPIDSAIRVTLQRPENVRTLRYPQRGPSEALDYMKHTCGRCGYSWWTRPLDEPEQRPDA